MTNTYSPVIERERDWVGCDSSARDLNSDLVAIFIEDNVIAVDYGIIYVIHIIERYTARDTYG